MEPEKLRKNSVAILICIIMILGSCSSFWGAHPITDCIFLWDAGTYKERLIIYNEKDHQWNIVSGIPVIPSNIQYQNNMSMNSSGHVSGYSEYVKEYLYNEPWILATTEILIDSMKEERFWIVKLPQKTKGNLKIIEKNTFGPLSRETFDSIADIKGVPESIKNTFLIQCSNISDL